jgi:hypothetical protein
MGTDDNPGCVGVGVMVDMTLLHQGSHSEIMEPRSFPAGCSPGQPLRNLSVDLQKHTVSLSHRSIRDGEGRGSFAC